METGNKPPTANQITAELLIRLPKEFPNVKVWRSNRIDAMAVGKGGKLRRVSAGINGQGDLTGIAPNGKRIELEVKADYAHGRDKISAAQEAFCAMILGCNGIYILADHIGWSAGKPDISSVIEELRKACQ